MSRRQKASAARRAAYWATRTGPSQPPEDRAAAAWDWLRTTIADLPSTDQREAWGVVFEQITGLRRSITDGEFTSGSHTSSANRSGSNGQTRVHAREAIVHSGH